MGAHMTGSCGWNLMWDAHMMTGMVGKAVFGILNGIALADPTFGSVIKWTSCVLKY